MIVVSDTSPITNLMQIGELELLRQIFGKIVIPQEVFVELCQVEDHKEELTKLDWIEAVALSDTSLKDKADRTA